MTQPHTDPKRFRRWQFLLLACGWPLSAAVAFVMGYHMAPAKESAGRDVLLENAQEHCRTGEFIAAEECLRTAARSFRDTPAFAQYLDAKYLLSRVLLRNHPLTAIEEFVAVLAAGRMNDIPTKEELEMVDTFLLELQNTGNQDLQAMLASKLELVWKDNSWLDEIVMPTWFRSEHTD